jgi:hypothetical protein
MRPPTSRYQSQFLNFLNQQTQRLKDQTGLMWRHVKLATVWGSQIVLYPIYALFQATRMANRQLRHAAYRALSLLMPGTDEPKTDTAIQKVLGKLDYNATIQAIASDLQTRELCLISTANQTIALAPDQQKSLQHRITVEIAEYWHRWRQYQRRQAGLQLTSRAERQLARQTGLTITDRPNLIAPVRFFYQLMAWVQQGDIAHQLNLFAETAIVPQPSAEWFVPHLGRLPGDAVVLMSAAAIDWDHVFANLTSMEGVSSLIRSAVHHFFGHHQPTIAAAPKPTELADPWESSAVEITAETVEPNPAESFVTGELVDLETLETSVLASAAATIAANLPMTSGRSKTIAPETPALPSRSLKQKIAGLVKQVRGRISKAQTARVPTISTPSIASLPQPPTAANLTWNNVFSSDPTTTWIETSAEHIGYIQHPLEKLLGWVDRAFVWVETHVLQLWQQCKNLWQSVANR